MTTDTFRKSGRGGAGGPLAWEVAGLRWLAAAGAARVVGLRSLDGDVLVLDRLDPGRPTPDAAASFGHDLARLHDAGAPAFGSAPPGWTGQGWFGPADDPRPMAVGSHTRWGEHLATDRLLPLADDLAPLADDAVVRGLRRVAERAAAGTWDDGDPPARLHGDLWSGNVMWTTDGAVLIDPAAHGGHRVTDLAMLALFGLPHLGVVVRAYEEARPLPDGWRDLVGLHQLYPVGMHAVLFGGGYHAQLAELVRRHA